MGRDVVFGAGEYRPGAEDGKRLLAHELAHTIQQPGPGTALIRRQPGDGHDLKSYLFTGDPILEAVYDGKRELNRTNPADHTRPRRTMGCRRSE